MPMDPILVGGAGDCLPDVWQRDCPGPLPLRHASHSQGTVHRPKDTLTRMGNVTFLDDL